LIFASELSNLYTVPASIRKVYGLDPSGRIEPLDPFQQVDGILLFGKGSDLNPEWSRVSRPPLETNNPKFDLVGPVPSHPQRFRPCERKVEDSSFGKGTAVIDPDGYLASRRQGPDYGNGTERQRPVRRRQLVHVVTFAVGGRITMKTRSVPGRDSPFDITDWVSGEANGFRGWTGTSGREREGHRR
jgi:hypothetical protein